MVIQESIEKKLTDALKPSFMEVLNESHMHSGTEPETHFKVTLVSSEFDSLRKVQRHQKVYGLLKEELDGPVHALALHLYTDTEWQERDATAPESPNCLGGSKKDPLMQK